MGGIMKVLTVQAHNVMRIADIDFDLDGHHLYLVGGPVNCSFDPAQSVEFGERLLCAAIDELRNNT
jgi:hypothetical protein